MNETKTEPIRVLVISEDSRATSVITESLSDSSEFKLIGIENTGRHGAYRAVKLAPDIIIVDVNFVDMNSIQIIEIVKKQNSTTKFIAMMGGQDPTYILKLLRVGAHQILGKPLNKEEFLAAVISVVKKQDS